MRIKYQGIQVKVRLEEKIIGDQDGVVLVAVGAGLFLGKGKLNKTKQLRIRNRFCNVN